MIMGPIRTAGAALQSPCISPQGSSASLNRGLSRLALGDVTEFPIVPPERGLVKATLEWRHVGQACALPGPHHHTLARL